MTRYLQFAARVGILVAVFLLLRQLSDRNLQIVSGTVLTAVFAAWLHDEIRRRRRNPLEITHTWIRADGTKITLTGDPSIMLTLWTEDLDRWARDGS